MRREGPRLSLRLSTACSRSRSARRERSSCSAAARTAGRSPSAASSWRRRPPGPTRRWATWPGPARAAVFLDLVIALKPQAFLPYFLWVFAREFPSPPLSLTTRRRFQLMARVSAVAGLLLFALNLLGFLLDGIPEAGKVLALFSTRGGGDGLLRGGGDPHRGGVPAPALEGPSGPGARAPAGPGVPGDPRPDLRADHPGAVARAVRARLERFLRGPPAAATDPGHDRPAAGAHAAVHHPLLRARPPRARRPADRPPGPAVPPRPLDGDGAGGRALGRALRLCLAPSRDEGHRALLGRPGAAPRLGRPGRSGGAALPQAAPRRHRPPLLPRAVRRPPHPDPAGRAHPLDPRLRPAWPTW